MTHMRLKKKNNNTLIFIFAPNPLHLSFPPFSSSDGAIFGWDTAAWTPFGISDICFEGTYTDWSLISMLHTICNEKFAYYFHLGFKCVFLSYVHIQISTQFYFWENKINDGILTISVEWRYPYKLLSRCLMLLYKTEMIILCTKDHTTPYFAASSIWSSTCHCIFTESV